MNSKVNKYVLVIFWLILLFSINFIQAMNSENSNPKIQQTSNLVIYTYESLMWDTYYDLESNFSAFSNIDKILINRFADANEIVARLVAEKDNPVADVVIGIDNALIHSTDKTSILEKYEPGPVEDLQESLIKNLDPDGFLWPYDYGLIALFYQNQIVNKTLNPVLNNLTLESLSQSDLLGKLIIQNPKFSSPGLGFLLWTIAVYGDPQKNINGILGSDWRLFWENAGNKVNITKSWGDAFTLFFEPKENKPIMVSYGTSPAYGYCLWNDNSTSAILTYENNTQNAWLQIEGIGLVKGAPNKENGKKFIDWFLGPELQSNIPTSQWMYPANSKATIPECFNKASISPDSVFQLNSILKPDLLKTYLSTWQDEWEILIVNNQIVSGFETISFIMFAFSIGIITIIRRKLKNN